MITAQSAIAELQKLPPQSIVHFLLITPDDIKRQAAKRKLALSDSALAELHEILANNYDSNRGIDIQQINIALDTALIKEGFITPALN